MTATLEIRRRSLLLGGAAVALSGAVVGRAPGVAAQEEVKPLPGYAAWKDADALIVHSENTIETRRDALGTSVITPKEKLYIRNNISPPDESIVADRDAWQVELAGVGEPGTLTVAELKSMGLTTLATVLQCSGNGRSYFQAQLTGDQKISGTPWQVGAAGCVIWSGVPLSAVVEALGGPAEGMNFITGTGGEVLPADVAPMDVVVERSVPIETLEDVMLAWEMNGEPIPLAHGGPLRMIVPGYSGINNIKYVKRVALTEAQSEAKIQQTSYRMHPLGEQAGPDQPSIWEQPVKSWVTSPVSDRMAGRVQIAGVAFGSMSEVESVEVSTDGGQTWQQAELIGPDLGRFAWRNFVLSTELPAGTYSLVSRATDANGNTQPRDPEMNGSGYSHNGWLAPAVALTLT